MTDDELVDALKALAHPVRLRIMKALPGTERNVGEIDDAADIDHRAYPASLNGRKSNIA